MQAGKYERAISLLVKHGWWDRLLSLMRQLDQVKEMQPLRAAVAAFRQAGMGAAALACTLLLAYENCMHLAL